MLRTPAPVSLRCPFCFSWWAIVLRWSHQQSSQEENLNHGSLLCLHVLPAHPAGDKTWQRFPVVLFWVLGWWLCIPSTHPEKLCQFVTCLIIFLTRTVWKKLPYVSLGWPKGRMPISKSRLFSLCSEGHSSIPLLSPSVRLVSRGSSSYLLTSNDPIRVRASGSQSNYADRWTDSVLFYQILFVLHELYL